MTTHNQAEKTQKKKGEIGEETLLKISKEVAIKFIEMGRITPATFEESFKNIHATIKTTVNKG